MLVSLAITLMMMAAVVTLFQNVTDSVTGSRSIIEMSERLRAARNRLQADLIGATASMTPPLRPENDEGYFEYIEGGVFDSAYATGTTTMFGDADDVLMFTVRSRGEPFVGKYSGSLTVESQVAEVAYFCVENGRIVDATTDPPTQLYTLYRRVLLVSPSTNVAAAVGPQVRQFYNTNDLSAHFVLTSPGSYSTFANTLGDLTKRENRFAHFRPSFPGSFPFDVSNTILTGANEPDNASLLPLSGNRLGDDVLLTNVLAFDVQVFDPGAAVQVVNGVAVSAADPGFASGGATAATGAYIDLGTAREASAGSRFNYTARRPIIPGSAGSQLAPFGLTTSKTYDTWSLHYENNGVQENSAHVADGGTNGLDDDGDGVVDEADEMDTQPPFAAPLRGIRVIIRVYEPSSQQVREVTVVQDFLPE